MDTREPTRTRTNGTKVTKPATPAERIEAIRSIVEQGQYAKVDGTMIDLFSAGAIMTVYNAIGESARAKFCALPAGKMAVFAFAVIKKAEAAK